MADYRIQDYPGMFPEIERTLVDSGFGAMTPTQREWLSHFAGGNSDEELWSNAVRQYQHSQDKGGFGNLFQNPAAIFAGVTGGLGGMTGANLATGGDVKQGIGMDLAALGAGAGAASVMGAGGLAGAGAVGGTAAEGATAGAAAAGGGEALAGGSGLTAGAGTGEVLGTGGALSGGAYSSAGGSGLTMGAAGGSGLSVTPAASMASGFGGATGAGVGVSTAASGNTIGSILGSVGGLGNIVNTGLTLYGLNALSNSYRSLADAQRNNSSLDQPQRAPYQNNLAQLVNNPQQYLSNDPFASSLAAMYKNNVIPRQVAQSGNPASVLDTAGSQFVNSIAGNYNQQVGNLSGIAGFGFPQSPYAGYQGGQLGAGAAMANFSGLQSLGNLFGNNMSGIKVQGQSGSSGPFNSTVV